MVLSLVTEKDVAATPPNETAVAPVNPVPVMVTCEPLYVVVGVNDVMEGIA